MCQVIGTRSDIFPPEYVKVLSQCHDRLPPRPFERDPRPGRARARRPAVEQFFTDFDPQPLAAASLAQVHRARRRDGRLVAVKVQYPDIEEIVRVDIAGVTRVCRVYRLVDRNPLDLLPLLEELTTHLALELDFRREADSADRVRALFKDEGYVVVPEMQRDLSTRRVLTMEFVDGIKVTDVAGLRAAGLDPADVVQTLMRIYVRMILAYGFFQADPHPGNLFVRPNGQIVLLDFGLAKDLPPGFGLGMFELMFSMMTLNEAAMLKAFDALGFATKTGDPKWLVEIARRMVEVSGKRFEGEFTEDMTEELFTAHPREPDRHGAERLRPRRPRLRPAQRHRPHPRRARQRARGDGARGDATGVGPAGLCTKSPSGRPSRRRQKRAAPQGERLAVRFSKRIIPAHAEEAPPE